MLTDTVGKEVGHLRTWDKNTKIVTTAAVMVIANDVTSQNYP